MRPRTAFHIGTMFLVALAIVIAFNMRVPAWPPAGKGTDGASPGASTEGLSVDDDGTVIISINNYRFSPADLHIKVGTRVAFVNDDDVQHNIKQSDSHRVGVQTPLFDSPILPPGHQWSYVFNKPGEFPIVCTVDGHQLMGMVGRIVVTE